MPHSFKHEDVRLSYELLQEPRKTLAATVYPDGSVMVKAPEEAEKARIDEFLTRRWRWILKQQRYFGQFKEESPKEYVSGETFRYLGRAYKLLVRKAQTEPRVLLRQGTLTVMSSKPEDRERTRNMLEAWYRDRAEVIFNERLDICFARFPHCQKPKLIVRKLKRRWGSYLKRDNRIHLNVDLIRANKMQIDYVITHELCHIQHPRHNRAFFRSLEAKLPDWSRTKRKLELDTLGRS